jgi:all-trans-8'-apo-beta-carotenal 15,15'-oxygenase
MDESACFYRFELDLASGKVDGHRHEGAKAGDFPMWDERKTGLKTRYGYVGTAVENGTPYSFNAMQKVDLETGDTLVHDFGPGRFTSEALFVPRNPDSEEDDGWLISVIFNAHTGKSEVVLVDARTMEEEVAVIPLRHHIPYGFHGHFAHQVFES